MTNKRSLTFRAVIPPGIQRQAGSLFLACLLPVTALPGNAEARPPLYGVLEHEGLLNCEALEWSGQMSEAQLCYRDLVSTLVQPPEIRAEAMWAMGDLHSANNLFQTAVESSPEDPVIRLRWGELFLETYQNQDALILFEEALNLDSENAWAHIGAAEALDGGEPDVINQHMSAVMDNISSPPGAKLRGMLLVLDATMMRDDYDQAAEMLEEIRELVEDNDLLPLELLAYEAAFAFLTQEDPLPAIEAALEINPAYGDAWAIPARFASTTRRYREAGEFYEKAVEAQPDHWVAHAELGQNHLRLNNIQPGIDHIRLSFDGDPFNPMTVNLLRLLDTFLDDFVSVSYPDPPEDPLPELTMRLHRDERGILNEYARRLSEESIALYKERYRFEPKETIIVELYPNHEDFVVRTIGMPGVGILGVTFGYLFAMDSPTSQADPGYHWGTTLWHEMAHVFTVEASDHMVPRWYSEGTSVYEEWHTGPTSGRKIPVNVLQAMAEDKFLSVSELDDGFMRPTYQDQVIVTYMQSGLVFEFIEENYGWDPIVDMLYMFNDGTSPEAAIEQVLGLSVKEFDQQFEDYIDQEFGDFLPHLEEWNEHRQQAFSAYQEGNYQLAISEANAAIFLYPDYADIDSPYVALARAYREMGDRESEFTALQSYWNIGGYYAPALMSLGEIHAEKGNHQLAAEVYEDVLWVDPFLPQLHDRLGDAYMATGEHRKALTEYEVFLELNPIDKATANLKLAKAWHALGNSEESMNYLMTALDIAPQFRDAQRFLVEMMDTEETE